MISIRPNVFETNSSSVHAICMCSQEEYKQFENGVLMWHSEHLIPTDEAYANLVKDYTITDDTPDYCKSDFKKMFDEKIPSRELFDKACKQMEGFNRYTYHENDRKGMTDDEFYVESICEWFNRHDYGTVNSYNQDYETFYDSKDGIVAFGYYGHD